MDCEPSKVVAEKPANRRSQQAVLTGSEANFSTLSLQRSHDPVLCIAWEIHGRPVTVKWKQMLVGLRVLHSTWGRMRRNPRWMSSVFAKEVASIYGHLGAAARYVRGQHRPSPFH